MVYVQCIDGCILRLPVRASVRAPLFNAYVKNNNKNGNFLKREQMCTI